MLRRFETYRFEPHASEDARDRLRTAFRDSSRHIPEVLHSAVGAPTGGVVQLVWEHAYPSAEAYRRYMEHPFHASVLDRYLLADSPERIVEHSELGIGLAGYTCDGPKYFLAAGVRRLVFLDLRRAGPDEIDAVSVLARRATAPTVSVFAANTLATAWFDGESPLGPEPRWSHLWEQGFRDDAARSHFLDGNRDPGGASGQGWDRVPGVAAALVVSYSVEPGWGYLAPAPSPLRSS